MEKKKKIATKPRNQCEKKEKKKKKKKMRIEKGVSQTQHERQKKIKKITCVGESKGLTVGLSMCVYL